MKKILALTLGLIMVLSLVTVMAESVTIAPEVVPGKIMGYVINENGAAVYQDVFVEGASLEPVDTIEYGTEVDIRTLGLGYCRLRRDGKEMLYVRTKDLSFSNEAFEDQIAIVFLKRSKNLPLHKAASASSKTITKIADGSYVVVLEKGEEFSRVLYGKYDGYLQNAYLSFRVAWQEEVGQGKLRDPKKPARKTTVNLRSADSLNGKKVASPHTLQQVTVLQIKGEWAEIETDKGIHGYMKADWVEMTEPGKAEEKEEKTETPADETTSEPEVAEPEENEEKAAAEDAVESDAEEDLAPEWEEDDSE